MAEPVAKPARRIPDDPLPPRADDFPGCREVRIPRDEIEDYEGRIEYWDARNEAAFIAEPTTTYHEYGTRRLTRLMALIAMRRGAAITVVGSADLVVRDGKSHRRVMQADESVYLRTADAPEDRWIEAGVHRLPDVVLEVDYSTDARRYKLGVYESWGFPEVWIEVPDAGWRFRPKNRGSALTIHLLEGGRYVEAPSSRAFPGWTAPATTRPTRRRATGRMRTAGWREPRATACWTSGSLRTLWSGADWRTRWRVRHGEGCRGPGLDIEGAGGSVAGGRRLGCLCPALDVASQGETREHAFKMLEEARYATAP